MLRLVRLGNKAHEILLGEGIDLNLSTSLELSCQQTTFQAMCCTFLLTFFSEPPFSYASPTHAHTHHH